MRQGENVAIPDAATLLAGFVLAHAAWSVSDLPEGDLLVPMAITEVGGERKLTRFEAETQEQAIAKGKEFVADQQASSSAWAFAREGQMKTSDGYIDVLVVDAWAKGMTEPITFIQPFQPYASGAFKLLGPAVPVVAGSMLSPEQSEPYLSVLYRGVGGHGKAAALWESWQ
jgi:hypothetical protein